MNPSSDRVIPDGINFLDHVVFPGGLPLGGTRLLQPAAADDLFVPPPPVAVVDQSVMQDDESFAGLEEVLEVLALLLRDFLDRVI
jgi:hypothetical protein